ncbi:MAG: hypothetical protein M1839_003712 [Geoglossum umbratile]|nr:MAG: hypothetical protein M1839_003712 [Geoglossum umbratile]
MSDQFGVYYGLWTNYATNEWVLTTSNRLSIFLQGALPVFITLVGQQFWGITKFALHQSYAVRRGTDDFYHQRQTLLRNSSDGFWIGVKLLGLWNSRRPVHRVFPRILLVLILGLILYVGWNAAAIFVPFTWGRAGDEVLVRSPHCGLSIPLPTTQQGTTDFRRFTINQTILAETYTQQCYAKNTSSLQCGIYPKVSLPFSAKDSSCPFTSQAICISANSTPYQLDSGYIDSSSDLGINAPLKNGVAYRKVTTCSPVHGTPFAWIVNANETNEVNFYPPGARLQRFYFGPVPMVSNWTFEYSEFAPIDRFGYDLTVLEYNPTKSNSVAPAWAMNETFCDRSDADTSIYFLTPNHVLYQSPVYDPYFLSGESYTDTVIDRTFFAQAYLLSDVIPSMGFNPTQLAAIFRIIESLSTTRMVNSPLARGAAALLASKSVTAGLLQTGQLPKDQWRLEVTNWFAMSLAKLQQATIDFAAGPSSPDLLKYLSPPTDTDTIRLCSNQRVRMSRHTVNFNFAAILVVICLGLPILILGITLNKCCDYVGRTRGMHRLRLEWTMDEALNLQRLGYEAAGISTWERADSSYPHTVVDPLPALDISNLNHPILTPAPPVPPALPVPPASPPPPPAPAQPPAQPPATSPAQPGRLYAMWTGVVDRTGAPARNSPSPSISLASSSSTQPSQTASTTPLVHHTPPIPLGPIRGQNP